MDNKPLNKYVFKTSYFQNRCHSGCVRTYFRICTCNCFVVNSSVCEAATDFKTVGKSAYLVDYATGTVLYSRKENERLPIASMVKIMTSLLTLEAADRGDISLDDEVEVSQNAASMGGSQVFLDAGSKHKASELLKTVIVASANDSCVALAEHVCGSVENFVARMNARAKELGMNDTSFKNCTGLPAAESFSSAKDVSIMFSQLIKHDKFFEYAKVWLEDYKHPDGRATTITNTNKLVRFYQSCDGGKRDLRAKRNSAFAQLQKSGYARDSGCYRRGKLENQKCGGKCDVRLCFCKFLKRNYA